MPCTTQEIQEGLGLSSSTAIVLVMAVSPVSSQPGISKVCWQRSLSQIPGLKLSEINLPSSVPVSVLVPISMRRNGGPIGGHRTRCLELVEDIFVFQPCRIPDWD